MQFGIANVVEVDALWPRLAKGFQHACERCGEMTAGELWEMARSGHGFLIVGSEQGEVKFASVWRFQSKDGRPVFRCEMMFGENMREWLPDAYAWIAHLANENGAKWLVAEGRRGWLRMFDGAVISGPDYEVEI